ncbi:uncharacterized protein FIBRA_03423 [Fibroporia radiculosa]|uniref:GS catalytic domain-containing protein n=1 Tax=Fibroporia radiculosa TaxID=599839 RepID=J4G5E8_9APHY|nr:uncharacterized protein FIBRA_03423 [Fibroporia radiculosa]CCM01373.1 predicted protein [Fibroporia radiculosa]
MSTKSTLAYGVRYTPDSPANPVDALISSAARVLFQTIHSYSCRYVRVQWVDLINTARFRVLPLQHFQKLFTAERAGVCLTHATLGLVGPGITPGFSGTGEYLLVIDPASVRPCVFAPEHAVVMGWIQEKVPSPSTGIVCDLCPRTMLNRIVADAQQRAGLKFLAGFESEFILLSETSPRPVFVNHADWSTSAKLLAGRKETVVLEEIVDALMGAGIEVQMYHAEAAPGQYEIVTGPLPPLESADAIVHTRETIRNVASKHGLHATFAPRLHSDNCGSGAHMHLSMHSAMPKALRASDASRGPTLTPTERSFLQTLLAHLPSLCALMLPTAASYARVEDGIWSGGTYSCWGTDNKEAPVRLCGPGGEHHLELKCVDGTANPYLVLAGVLAAGMRGVAEGALLTVGDCEVPVALMNDEERKAVGLQNPGRLPRTIKDARELLRKDDHLRGVLGENFVAKFTAVNEVLEAHLQAESAEATVARLVGPTNHNHDTFPANHAAVTFVGRPFPLEEAPEHFSRLRRWGLTFIRFLLTWEAVEHAGPGIYDMEYLDYVRELLSVLPQYGITAFVVMHQDVWSRYSGGSGSPAWTLETVGFDLHGLEEPGAAWLKGVKGGGHVEEERGLWPCGYQKLAAATMATCFWAGDTFAPKLKVKDANGKEISIQAFLQNAFLNMWEVVAKTLGDLEGVLGFEMMNEPHRGYVELQSMHAFDYNTDLHLGHVPTAFQSFTLGAGHPTEIGFWTRSFPMPTRLTSKGVLNTARQRAWRDNGPTQGKCLWEMHGVWGWDKIKDEGVVLRESYFTKDPVSGRKVDWYTDFYFPFVKTWTDRVRSASSPNMIVFIEPIPNEFCPTSWTPERRPTDMAFAPHWYDLNALFAKAFGDFTVNVQGLSRGMFPLKAFYWGHQGARDNFSLQIRNLVEAGYRSLGETPVIIGECGIPMDMNKGESFQTDRWTWQTRMMDAMVTALEQSLVGFTLWNYNPDNDDTRGDDWNGENFSWYSRRRGLPASWLDFKQTSATLDNGARILRATVRPYPAKTAGIPLKFDYEMNTGRFTFEWVVPSDLSKKGSGASASVQQPPVAGHPALTSKDTEIFMPSMLARERQIVIEGLGQDDRYRYDEQRQTLTVTTGALTPGQVHRIVVSLKPPLKASFEVNSFWDDFGGHILGAAVVISSLLIYILLSNISV